MRDERSRHLRRLNRLRASARRWTVTAAALVGATAVLAPYQGLGPLDAVWAALAGGSVALTWWRWADHRALAGQPVPEPADPALAGDPWLSFLSQLPGGHALADRARRARTRAALRGSAAMQLWERLDRSARTLREMTLRLRALDRESAAEATAVERRLRELTDRIAALEEALRLAPQQARGSLQDLRSGYLSQLERGVVAYEQFVVAAARHLSEADRVGGHDDDALAGLTEATDRLRAVSEGLAELRRLDQPDAGGRFAGPRDPASGPAGAARVDGPAGTPDQA
ncbi:MAG TPA: hypothetical protein VKY81_07330 [Natronosporangium sp.]|nr:hypothetical protein [Natronosporangium sp.]